MSPNDMNPHAPPAGLHFPTGFLFGAATSAHQVEGGCTNNDWWAWEQQGRVGQPSGLACDHYHRFREDFDIARALDHDAHRFSVEWSRIEPEEGRFSDEAIGHYRDVLTALRARGLEPIVTLHHFTLPLWLAAKGGWENPDAPRLFARFVAVVVDVFRDLARWWITINEPMAYAFQSYIVGEWPPGKRDYASALRVVRHMLLAHVLAWQVIHGRQPDAMVSVAQHGLALSPCEPGRWLDRLSVRVRSRLFNHMFIDGLHHGRVRVPGLLWETLPQARTLDFLGLNYYTRDFVHNAGLDLPGLIGRDCGRSHSTQIAMTNSLGWEVYPEGLGELVRAFSRYGLPIMITENGTCATEDADREAFVSTHLWQLVRAIEAGVPIVGYLYWSLLDNFEWAHGYGPRFGLVEVDYRTQERRIRPSALMLSALMGRLAGC